MLAYSIGNSLADTLDDLISSRRLEPQLAMRIMQHFDEKIAAVLGEKVKARMSFKVRLRMRGMSSARMMKGGCGRSGMTNELTVCFVCRATSTLIAFATKSGPS